MKNLQKITLGLIAILTIMFGFDNISEKKANEKVIVSSQAPDLTNSKSQPTIEISTSDAPYTNAGPLWTDNDIVIDSANDYQSISVATRRSNGEIYVVVSRQLNPGERYRLRIWHSPDGVNWSFYLALSYADADLLNPSMNIFTADSEYLIVAYEEVDTVSGDGDVRALRVAFGASSGTYSSISATGVDERDPDICNSDLQFPSNPWLYCAFESGDSIGFVRSVDWGRTWSARQIIGVGGSAWDYRDPDCAFGWHSSPDSMFIGVAWQYVGSAAGTKQLRFRKNTINGTAGYWKPTVYFDAPANRFDNYPCLQMTHGTYPSAVITFVRKDTVGTPDNADLYRFVTNDGGETWDTLINYNSNFASNVPHNLAVDDNLGYYHLVYRDQGGELKYFKARYDSTDHNPWSSYISVNSGDPYSDSDFPAVGVRDAQPYVCWADYHSPQFKLKFDAEWLQTGIEERPDKICATSSMILAPNPARGAFKVSYQVMKEGRVKILMYDVSGRIVSNLMDETKSPGAYSINIANLNLATGVYFIQLETPADITTKKMTIVK